MSAFSPGRSVFLVRLLLLLGHVPFQVCCIITYCALLFSPSWRGSLVQISQTLPVDSQSRAVLARRLCSLVRMRGACVC